MAPVNNFFRTFLLIFVLLLSVNLSHAHNFSIEIPEKTNTLENEGDGKLNDARWSQKITGITGIAFYVKENATGNNDGSSWENAFTNLSNALLRSTSGDTIRIARGSYQPAGVSFSLRDGVVILGGYSNTGHPTDAERNFAINPTILSGEVGNPLYPFDNLSTIITGNLVREGTVLDGFIIEKGYSNNTTQGVGINLWRSSPTIRNCVFRNNSSYNSSIGGSSIACQNNSNPTITNCFFLNNFDFGFSTLFIKTNCNPRLVNCVFSGNDGRFVVYANQSTLTITNCTFINNQIGTAVLPRVVRPGFVYAENSTSLTVANTIFYNNKHKLSTDTSDFSLNASSLAIVNSITQNYPAGNSNLLGADPKFKDVNNIAGPDNFYFTPDDGLQPERCSPTINMGSNAADSAILFDILQRPRIYNANSDIGAYEYQAGNGDDILSISNDSLIANYEYTDQNGWTNYYKDCQLLLSVKKNGQKIGAINDGTFKVVIKTTAGYGSGFGNNISQAEYVAPAVYWAALNRFWTIYPTKQPTDSILIRFPWSDKDFTDAKGTNHAVSNPRQLVCYTVDSSYSPLSMETTSDEFHAFYNNTTPTLQTWKYSSKDSVHYAEYYVKKINSGGIGTGTGLNKGPFALINNECLGGNKVFAATLTGRSFQWQVDKGNGFLNISNGEEYIGTTSYVLTLIAPSGNQYGYKFRCLVTGVNPDEYTPAIVLKFTAQWTGTSSTAWDEAANWSCGIVPDANTDVFIKGGTPFNPVVNTDLSCRSVRLIDDAIVTVLAGKKLMITGN